MWTSFVDGPLGGELEIIREIPHNKRAVTMARVRARAGDNLAAAVIAHHQFLPSLLSCGLVSPPSNFVKGNPILSAAPRVPWYLGMQLAMAWRVGQMSNLGANEHLDAGLKRVRVAPFNMSPDRSGA